MARQHTNRTSAEEAGTTRGDVDGGRAEGAGVFIPWVLRRRATAGWVGGPSPAMSVGLHSAWLAGGSPQCAGRLGYRQVLVSCRLAGELVGERHREDQADQEQRGAAATIPMPKVSQPQALSSCPRRVDAVCIVVRRLPAPGQAVVAALTVSALPAFWARRSRYGCRSASCRAWRRSRRGSRRSGRTP